MTAHEALIADARRNLAASFPSLYRPSMTDEEVIALVNDIVERAGKALAPICEALLKAFSSPEWKAFAIKLEHSK